MVRKIEGIDYISTAYGKPKENLKLKKIEQLGHPYLNKLYKQLLMAARDIFGSYSINVSSLSMLSYLLEVDFTPFFVKGLEALERLGKLKKHHTGSGWWIEVIPF